MLLHLINKSSQEKKIVVNRRRQKQFATFNYIEDKMKSELKKEARRENRRRETFGLTRRTDHKSRITGKITAMMRDKISLSGEEEHLTTNNEFFDYVDE